MTLALILLATVVLVLLIARGGVPPFLAILGVAIGLGLAFGLPGRDVIRLVGEGFGGILGGIGLIVVVGSLIGVALERSGAALVVAGRVLRWFGPDRPALAVGVIGALVSIPVFCDSGFILLQGLNRDLARRTGVPLGVLALALAGGLFTTHTLVPPTPGPIAAAGQLGADAYLGTLMLLGGLVSVPVLAVALLLTKRFGENLVLEDTQEHPDSGDWRSSKLNPKRDNSTAPQKSPPPAPLAFAPLLLPIGLIALGTTLRLGGATGPVMDILGFLGQPLPALLLGLMPAWLLCRRVAAEWKTWTADAIRLAGPILIVTGAGGAFGAVLKASNLAEEIGGWIGQEPLGLFPLLLLAFVIAALLKSAQGSSTNALVITAGMLAPLAGGLSGGYDYALLVLAIGGGAMTVSHANDSYFWVVSRFSGIPAAAAYRSYTLMTGVMGLTVLGSVLLLALFG